VIAAYKLPKETSGRSDAIQHALAGAARVPLQLAAIAADIVNAAETVLPGANPNVLSDVAVAADSARAALTSASVNVRINVAALKDSAVAAALAHELDGHLASVAVADRVSAAVLRRITGVAA
jgi:formiminotetrahydrofolate cyclodeaminase